MTSVQQAPSSPSSEYRRLRDSAHMSISSCTQRFSQIPEGWEDKHPKFPSRMESTQTIMLGNASDHSLGDGESQTVFSGCSSVSGASSIEDVVVGDDNGQHQHPLLSGSSASAPAHSVDSRPVMPGRVASKQSVPSSSSQRFKVPTGEQTTALPKIPRRLSSNNKIRTSILKYDSQGTLGSTSIISEEGEDDDDPLEDDDECSFHEDSEEHEEDGRGLGGSLNNNKQPMMRAITRQTGAIRLGNSDSNINANNNNHNDNNNNSLNDIMSPTKSPSKLATIARKVLHPHPPKLPQFKKKRGSLEHK